MKNDFTPSPSAMNQPSRSARRSSDDARRTRPRRSTLLFIRQFAHAYSCAPALPPALGAFIAN
ncbi:hypothetical protein ED551_07335 [Muribaculaceae bacterium Isolate-013 (NCI)]|nr:hypothetical protein ED551_07335 [Muribaculaceae bacterium Isolate-013 (NCI)]